MLPLRLVIDTNVIVSGALQPKGLRVPFFFCDHKARAALYLPLNSG